MKYLWNTWVVATMLAMCLGGCKTGSETQKEEAPPREDEDMGGGAPSQEQGEAMEPVEGEQEMALIMKIEQVPPAERTFKDDMFLVCHAPARVANDLTVEERQKELTIYISNNIYTSDMLEFFKELEVMDLASRDAYFEQTVNKLGLVGCPLLEEQKQHNASVVEDGEEMPESAGEVEETEDRGF